MNFENQKGASGFKQFMLLAALILMFISPLIIGLLGYHFFGPLGTLLGLGVAYLVWTVVNMRNKRR